MINRRQFVGTLTTGLLAAPLAAAAQDLRPKRVGVVLQGGPYHASVEGLRAGLKTAGLEEGRHFSLLVRDARGDLSAVEAAAKELEREAVDVIVALSTSVTLAAKRGTADVPIVFTAGSDPVAFGLVESIARPGGRFTGVHAVATDLTAKRLELLREIMPMSRRAVTFYNPKNPSALASLGLAREAARHLGIDFVEQKVASIDEVHQRLGELGAAATDAFFFVSDSMVLSQDTAILDRANGLGVATISSQVDQVRKGALAGYGYDFRDLGRVVAGYVVRILAGARPSELPVESYSRPALAINLKTAAALGLTIPPSILARADEVVE
jgi:putative ABC transport system substrate-binding protein